MKPNIAESLSKFKNLKKKKSKHESAESKSYEKSEAKMGTEKEYKKGAKICSDCGKPMVGGKCKC